MSLSNCEVWEKIGRIKQYQNSILIRRSMAEDLKNRIISEMGSAALNEEYVKDQLSHNFRYLEYLNDARRKSEAMDSVKNLVNEFFKEDNTMCQDSYEVLNLGSGDIELLTIEQIMNRDDVYQCVDCEEWFVVADCTDIDRNGMILCDSCNDNGYYFKCDHCGCYHVNMTMTKDSEVMICDSCKGYYYVCDDCGGLFEFSNSLYTSGDAIICYSCWDHGNYAFCDDCGTIIDCDIDSVYSNDTGVFCQYCWEENNHCNDLSQWVHEWDYRPYNLKFNGVTNPFKDIVFGIENEMDGSCSGREFCTDTENIEDIYLKHDGSIGDGGIEVVTHPMTMEYFKNEFPIDRILDTAKKYGFVSHDSGQCGLHVHVDRRSLGKTKIDQDYTIAKLLVLFEKFFDNELMKFSRRNESQVRQWAKNQTMEYDPDEDTIGTMCEKVQGKQDYNDRYYAINLTNRATVEFRIFRGTLNNETFKATIQFVETIIKFAKYNNINEIQRCKFTDMVKSDYAELNAYLERRKLLPVTTTQEESVSQDTQQAQDTVEPQWQTTSPRVNVTAQYDSIPPVPHMSDIMASTLLAI